MQRPGHIVGNSVLWALALGVGLWLPDAVFVPVVVVSAMASLLLLRAAAQTAGRYNAVPADADYPDMQPAGSFSPAAEAVSDTDSDAAPQGDAILEGEPEVNGAREQPLQTGELLELIARFRERLGDVPEEEDQLRSARDLTEQELRPRLDHLKSESKQVLSDVSRAYDISDNLTKTANDAFALAAKVQKGVENINGTLKQSLENTRFLEEQSKKISKILDLMGDISSQIQVLSMNASIVSARAGVHGKGFEVVAKEIRKLSHQTENSLQEISGSINEIQQTIRVVGGDTQEADTAAAEETKSLMSVAGSLQGVQLAVEVVHTVSTASKDRIQRQSDELGEIEVLYDRLDSSLSCVTSGETEGHDGTALFAMLAEIEQKIRDVAAQSIKDV